METVNTKQRVVLSMTVSLDGFINDKNGSVAPLYPDLRELRNTETLKERIKSTGAVVMGRKAYDMANGDFTDYEFQVPLFIITNHAPDTVAKSENEKLKFNFVTGIESALKEARIAAGDKDIQVIGGANVAQQLLNAGLIDEIEISIMPIILNGGLRLFDNLNHEIQLQKTSVGQSELRTDVKFQVLKFNGKVESLNEIIEQGQVSYANESAF